MHKNLLVTKLFKFQPQEIRAKVAALTKWRRLLGSSPWNNLSWFAPSPAFFGAAAEQAAARRPTARKTLWNAALWWNTYVGLRFPFFHGLLVAHRRPTQTHQPEVLLPLAAWQLCNLIRFAEFANGPQALFVGINLLARVATLRFRHAQRSSVPEFDEGRVSWRVTFGKRRQFGVRPGLDWCIPRFIFKNSLSLRS